MAAANLAVRFALEVAALGILAWWGASLDEPLLTRIAVAVAAPAAAALLWGRLVAPKARRRLPDPARFVAELALWVAAALALRSLAGPGWAAGFLVAALVTAALVRVWPEPAGTVPRRPV